MRSDDSQSRRLVPSADPVAEFCIEFIDINRVINASLVATDQHVVFSLELGMPEQKLLVFVSRVVHKPAIQLLIPKNMSFESERALNSSSPTKYCHYHGPTLLYSVGGSPFSCSRFSGKHFLAGSVAQPLETTALIVQEKHGVVHSLASLSS